MSTLRAVRLHQTVYHVIPVDTAREAVLRVPAAVTVRQVDTLRWLISLGLQQTTVSLVMQASMLLLLAVRQHPTVSLALLADTVRESARRVLAVVTVCVRALHAV